MAYSLCKDCADEWQAQQIGSGPSVNEPGIQESVQGRPQIRHLGPDNAKCFGCGIELKE
jgi:hypothetical protein